MPDQILLVDDDARLCTLLEQTLQRRGFATQSCRNGPEALEAAAARQGAGVMVLDYDLPGLNGAQTCARLRAHAEPEVAQMPVILLTGHPEVADEVGCLQAGADDFVEKPVNLPVLEARIGTLLRVAALRRQLQEQNRLLAEWQERHRHDLEAARLVQRAILPRHLPELPGWAFALQYTPLWPVGGDFYDWAPLSHGRALLWMADATGHGASAALVTALAKLLFRQAAAEEGEEGPAAVLAAVDRECCTLLQGRPAFTAACVELGPGQIAAAGAGHPPIVLVRGRGRTVEPLYSASPPLGLCGAPARPEATCATLERGDGFLLFSDGIYGAKGWPAFHNWLEGASFSGSPEEWRTGVMAQATALAGEGGFGDDLSLIAARYGEL